MNFDVKSEEFLCGGVASLVNISVTYPISKLIFRQQIHGFRIRTAVRQLRNEGPLLLYRGVLPPLLQKTASISFMFGFFDLFNSHLSNIVPLSDFPRHLFAGNPEQSLSSLLQISFFNILKMLNLVVFRKYMYEYEFPQKPMIINTVYLIGRIWNTVIISLSLRALYTVHMTFTAVPTEATQLQMSMDFLESTYECFLQVYIHICITLTWILTKFIHSHSYPLPDRLKDLAPTESWSWDWTDVLDMLTNDSKQLSYSNLWLNCWNVLLIFRCTNAVGVGVVVGTGTRGL